MCALGLYLAFLLIEDMIVGNHSTNISLDKNSKLDVAYNTFKTNMLLRKNITKRSIGKQNIHVSNISTSGKPSIKPIVRKATRKHYEMINMLWRKTKIFVDEDNIYTSTERTNANKMLLHKRQYTPLTFPTPSPTVRTTTSSKIEFYYMDDAQYSVNKKNCTEPNCKSKKIRTVTSHLPFLIFHLKGPYVDPIPQSSIKRLNHSRHRNEHVRISAIRLKEVQKLSRKFTAVPIPFTKEVKSTTHDKFFDNNAVMKRSIPPPPNLNILNATISSSNRYTYITESTTVYDQIKFFKIYDRYTRIPSAKKQPVQISRTDGKVDNNNKILLEHVDHGGHDHLQAKFVKKHITEASLHVNLVKDVTKSKANDIYKKEHNETTPSLMSTKSEANSSNSVFSYETAHWSDYPFAAVYIYELSQVHCDAAAISKHWLIASGSCLSRVSSKVNAPFEPYGEGQSAFVAYCGDLWWEAERVAYVKYTVVHPWYHPRDKTRQHLYNIGAIQVVNSMISACAGWAPVTLMSHQFAARAETTWATAVGWGLDRFDTRYGSTDLPKTVLMAYKSFVYFDSCPGNVGYSKAKRLDAGGMVNVHCLSLPPYYGEDTDPVHGGLLLADGKLIALYLQEERRPWGDQSAQYTGVWRLIPWLMDIAREPEEIDTVIFEL